MSPGFCGDELARLLQGPPSLEWLELLVHCKMGEFILRALTAHGSRLEMLHMCSSVNLVGELAHEPPRLPKTTGPEGGDILLR